MIDDENLSIVIYFFIEKRYEKENHKFSSPNPKCTEPTPYFVFPEIQNR